MTLYLLVWTENNIVHVSMDWKLHCTCWYGLKITLYMLVWTVNNIVLVGMDWK